VPRLIPPIVPAGRISDRAQPVLEAQGSVTLRPWSPADAATVMEAFREPSIPQWHMRRLDTRDETLAWIEAWHDRWRAESDASWAISTSDGATFHGHTGRIPFAHARLSALATAVGAPAFSLYRRRFVYIEGDRETGERERFFRICGAVEVNRFIEGGSAAEVVRRVADISRLAEETDEQLRVGGVIDRDFRTNSQVSQLREQAPVCVLECLEVENLFLHRANIATLLAQGGRDPEGAADAIRQASDRYAGMWILQRAALRSDLTTCRSIRERLYNLPPGRTSETLPQSLLRLSHSAVIGRPHPRRL
jgi:hypothetical protein